MVVKGGLMVTYEGWKTFKATVRNFVPDVAKSDTAADLLVDTSVH